MTHREQNIQELIKAKVKLEAEHYKKIQEIWQIECQIEKIEEKLKTYGNVQMPTNDVCGNGDRTSN